VGMKRETYERKFRGLFAEVIDVVDGEVQQWREHQIEVRKNQVTPDEFIYVVEWQGRALNAFALGFHKSAGGYPYIILHYDHHSVVISKLPRKLSNKEMELNSCRDLLISFIRNTIVSEAKKVALQQGFFATIKGSSLFVTVGGHIFRLDYRVGLNCWEVRYETAPKVLWTTSYCGNQHPLEFLAFLLKSLTLKVLL
jgi:hypothetical protein